jgi:uncharacterized 2Fe-2S/4Fe-4S cluster protein (DUF4445 family)
MPEWIVRIHDEEECLTVIPGLSLKDMLEQTRFRVKARCSGNRACGLCRVKINSGRLNEPTGNERVYLESNLLEQGMRLACQVYPEEDIGIQVVNKESIFQWNDLFLDENCHPFYPLTGTPREAPAKAEGTLGLAVDLGTTHLRFSLCDLDGNRRLAVRYCRNPQLFLGVDVITRLTAAPSSPEKAKTLQGLISRAFGEGAREITAEIGAETRQIVRMSLVGNTAMLSLLTGINFSLLTHPSHWSEEIPCIPVGTSAYAEAWNLHLYAEVEIIPPLGGFVGSDFLAGLVAVSLMDRDPGSLFIDFGTNTEIALWEGKALIVTSAAGGPAFEGSGIQCGMPAEEGAIHSAEIDPDTGKITFKVLMDTHPSGICGSGVIDLVACMLREGKLANTGSLEPGIARQGFILAEGPPVISVKKHDIDLFQRAKGAVMAGIKVLFEASGMDGKELKNIFVGGTFGSFLKVKNAQEIGLLPLIPVERIQLSGNTALTGCEHLMLFKESVNTMNQLRKRRMLVNLAKFPSFSEFYFESVFLSPVTVGTCTR